jgi:glucosamine 6-phosphate synthetase-like amidotransferase/phosphosugar isomerase protein
MVRECELAYITRAGVEIGVASTKAFTTQLAGLFLLTLALAQVRGLLSEAEEAAHLKAMRHLPAALQAVLALEPQVMAWAEAFARKENALFLGRGLHYPIALEGALKLKEISYIHAEAYPAGELKHGPLALVTAEMPVVTVAPTTPCWKSSRATCRKCAPAAASSTCLPTPTAASRAAKACTSSACPSTTAPEPHPARGAAAAAGLPHGLRAGRMWTSRAIWPRV